jgi:hypothetical protein
MGALSPTALDARTLAIVGSTHEFVPAGAPEWNLTFPGGVGAPALAASEACTL